jgi:hypothetical protein
VEDIPELIEVDGSSNVQAIGYEPDSRTLYVRFKPTKKGRRFGDLYRYNKVPEGVWKRFEKAPSKGTFIWEHVRFNYGYAKWVGDAWRSERALGKNAVERKREKKRRAERKREQRKRAR